MEMDRIRKLAGLEALNESTATVHDKVIYHHPGGKKAEEHTGLSGAEVDPDSNTIAVRNGMSLEKTHRTLERAGWKVKKVQKGKVGAVPANEKEYRLAEGNGSLGVPEQPNLKPLSQGKDPMTHMKPQSPASKPESANLKPVGTGKTAKDPMSATPQSPASKPESANLKPVGTGKAAKNPLREEADVLIADIIKGINALADGLNEGQDQLTFYRHDALKRIHATVRRYVD